MKIYCFGKSSALFMYMTAKQAAEKWGISDRRVCILCSEGKTRLDEKNACVTNREQALKEIKEWLNTYDVQKLFAYNASFDKRHLPEYSEYEWYDIMRLAAYRQYNFAIPSSADCCKTGRLKRGYGVEDILKILSKNKRYSETHNAVLDAQDELEIIQLLGRGIREYDIALI